MSARPHPHQPTRSLADIHPAAPTVAGRTARQRRALLDRTDAFARGRHRRPKQPAAARAVRTAVVAGTAAAVPLTGVALAGPAAAAKTSTWERLAQCESGGNWEINTGNGYYGGLQFSDSTWDAFGGERFAGRADNASKAEQIRIAEKVLDGQGWGAWPACSSKLGLGRSEAQGTPKAMTDRADKKDRTSTKDDRDQRDRSDRKDRKDKKGTKARADREQNRHRGAGDFYVVRSGDTLGEIAKRFDMPWRELYRLNRSVIGSDPDLVLPGQRLRV